MGKYTKTIILYVGMIISTYIFTINIACGQSTQEDINQTHTSLQVNMNCMQFEYTNDSAYIELQFLFLGHTLQYQQIQDNLGASLQRLLMVTEQYPDLKADQNFLALQDQLEGTENRIAVARKRFNDAVKEYNIKIRKFPGNIIANMSGFDKKQSFTASSDAQSAPKVEF